LSRQWPDSFVIFIDVIQSSIDTPDGKALLVYPLTTTCEELEGLAAWIDTVTSAGPKRIERFVR
jgi:hypothetical protein